MNAKVEQHKKTCFKNKNLLSLILNTTSLYSNKITDKGLINNDSNSNLRAQKKFILAFLVTGTNQLKNISLHHTKT